MVNSLGWSKTHIRNAKISSETQATSKFLQQNRKNHEGTFSTRGEVKYNFGRMIALARAEPVVIEKYGRPVVVMAFEDFEKLTGDSISPSRIEGEG